MPNLVLVGGAGAVGSAPGGGGGGGGGGALHVLEIRSRPADATNARVLELAPAGPAIELPAGYGAPYYEKLVRTRAGGLVLYVSDQTRGLLCYRVLDESTGKLSLAGHEAPTVLAQPAEAAAAAGTGESGTGGCTAFTVDRSACWLIAVNYVHGSVSVLSIAADGALGTAAVYPQGPGAHPGEDQPFGPVWGEHPKHRQGSAHPHGVAVDAANRFVHVADLGTNSVHSFSFDAATGQLVEVERVTLQVRSKTPRAAPPAL